MSNFPQRSHIFFSIKLWRKKMMCGHLWAVVGAGVSWWWNDVLKFFFTNTGSFHKIFSGRPMWKVKVWHKIWLRGGSSRDGPEKNNSSKELSADALWSETITWSGISQRPIQRSHIKITRECSLKPHILQIYRVGLSGGWAWKSVAFMSFSGYS